MDTHETLATELLHEIKQNAKRWFIAFCVMVVLEVLTIAGFMWYITLPVEEYTYEQSARGIEDSDVRQIIGSDDYGNSMSESNLSEESH